MMTLNKRQQADYERFCLDRDSGRILTPDGLRFICEANGYDPEKIGRHFLEVLTRLGPMNMVEPKKIALRCGNCKHFIGGGDWDLCCQIGYGLHYDDSEACQDYEPKED